MPSRARPSLALFLTAALSVPGSAQAPAPTCVAPTSSGELLTLVLEEPLPGSKLVIQGPCCASGAPVRGTAAVGLRLLDMYFVIDSSGSTAQCSGSDIDGDGIVGVPTGGGCSDPGDSVLAAEVKAVRDSVATLSPATARVAILQFSNPEGFFGLGERQRLVQELTDDFNRVNAALDEIEFYGSAGATDYGGGLTLLINEHLLRGDPVNRRQFGYFLSDGVPTFPVSPYNSEEPGDSQVAIDAADQAAANQIRVNTFGVGFIPSQTQDPVLPPRCEKTLPNGQVVITSTLECIALRTDGAFYASNDPADIVDQVRQSLPDTGVSSVTVFNDAFGASVEATLSPDGSWVAEVPIGVGGVNPLRALALAEDGTPCEVLTDLEVTCQGAKAPRPGPAPRSPRVPRSPLSACSAASSR